jgi:hypothetical protein
MRLGTIAQAELLARLGVGGADLFRFTVLDSALPVVVVADTSSLSAAPQRRQSHISLLNGAVAGQLGVLEIIPTDSALQVIFKNDGNAGLANQTLNVMVSSNGQPTAGLVDFVAAGLISVSYQIPDATFPIQVGYLARNGTVVGYAGSIAESVPVGQRSDVYRCSPGTKIALVGSVANTAALTTAHVEEFTSYERSR